MISPQNAEATFGSVPAGSAFRDTFWQALLIAAVALLVIELLFKKLILPIGTIAASNVLQSEKAADQRASRHEREERGRRREKADDGSDAPTYADLRRQVAEAYQRESRRPKPVRWYEGGEHNPVAERKIYIARKRKE